jgi:hypothetical protein
MSLYQKVETAWSDMPADQKKARLDHARLKLRGESRWNRIEPTKRDEVVEQYAMAQLRREIEGG